MFLFQAEDGIRDGHVTGVQTCALPISAEFYQQALPGFMADEPRLNELAVQARREIMKQSLALRQGRRAVSAYQVCGAFQRRSLIVFPFSHRFPGERRDPGATKPWVAARRTSDHQGLSAARRVPPFQENLSTVPAENPLR